MRRIIPSFLILITTCLASEILVETYNPGTIIVEPYNRLTVLELSFSLPEDANVLVTTGGVLNGYRLYSWLEVDGDSLVSTLRGVWWNYVSYCFYDMPIVFPFSSGEHTIILKCNNTYSEDGEFREARLQALIFLPDEPNAVTESSADGPAVLPADGVSSLITSGPYVDVTDASQLVDASGRVIENSIAEDKVYINHLPTGTYFARDGENTVVKIVKID